MRIVFATSEVAPLNKSGGLADVSRALPRALSQRGCTPTVVVPHFDGLPAGRAAGEIEVEMASERYSFSIREQRIADGVECLSLHARNGRGWGAGDAYRETDTRPYLAFSRGVAELALRMPGGTDVVHANDWHTGHCADHLARRGGDRRPATVLTIHNAAYRGPLGPTDLELTAPPPAEAEPSLLALGVRYSDQVTTVSSRHRDELLTRRLGMGLADLLSRRRGSFWGIPNALDYEEFDPGAPGRLALPVGDGDCGARRRNKRLLQELSGLPAVPGVVVVGVVSRLAEHKGAGLLLRSLDEVLALGVQLVVCGVGTGYGGFLARAAERDTRIAYHPDTSEDIARLVYAGADLVLVPSRYEPFGLVPLIALRHGAMPVVRLTGGMADTISPLAQLDPPLAVGFDDYTPKAMVAGVREALAALPGDDAGQWTKEAMSLRMTWDQPAEQYLRLYRRARAGQPT